MLSVQRLASELGLSLLAAGDGARRPIRWVHISELADPTPWLSGGELLLTTGIALTDARHQRAFVKLLDEKGAAGIGFGTGFDHASVPKALIDEAQTRELPLFEVPYELPFIAVTERAFTDLVNEQYSALERSIEVHERLEGLVLAERGLEEVIEVVASVTGPTLLLDEAGSELARSRGKPAISRGALKALSGQISERSAADRRAPFVVEDGPLAEAAIAVPVPAGRAGERRWLVVTKPGSTIAVADRLLARQAATVVGLELMRQRVVRETERRLAGDVLAEALGGGLGADAVAGRLRPFGISEAAAVLLFELDDPAAGQAALESELRRAGVPALTGLTSITGSPLLCAIASPGEADPIELARAVRSAIATATGAPVRAAASRAFAIAALRRAFHEARYALEATALANGNAPDVASHSDLGAFTLLLSVSDENALRVYADDLLGPIEQAEGEYGAELLRSLEAFIEANGQWESAARTLFCHRHTLRYRIRKVEEMTGRDLGDARHRIELWLALRARELVR